MTLDKEIFLAIISFLSAVISGFMLYKSNISKHKTISHTETLGAEAQFRDELLESISSLKSEVEEIKIENTKLKDELYSAKVQIKNLEILLSEKIDKCKILENFLKHLTIPAWVRLKDDNGKFRFAFVNFSFCNNFNVSREYCIGYEDYSMLSDSVNLLMSKIDSNIINKKIGSRDKIAINNKVWTLLKFPMMEDGVIIGISGMLVDCGE